MEVWYYFETMVGFSPPVLPNLTCVFIKFTTVFMSLLQESNSKPVRNFTKDGVQN